MYRKGDLGGTARALRVLDGLTGFRHGRALADLADEFGVSVKTIRRDIQELITSGFEIELVLVDGRAGAKHERHDYSYIAITKSERYTLLAVRRVFDVLRGTPLWQDIESLQTKLEQRMSPQERAEHDTFRDRFAYVPDGGTKAYEDKVDILDDILTGVLDRRVLRFESEDAAGRRQKGYLAPFSLLLYKHGLYVAGRRLKKPEDGPALTDGEVYPFAVERFVEVERVKGSSFTPPASFRLDAAMQNAFEIHLGGKQQHTVVVEFSKERAAYVRARIFQSAQIVETLDDGRVRVSFPCTSLRSVVSWVLEWGPHARAISPPELVDQVVSELDAARAQYAR
jgi:predicted DNA-binding transcriptional regulator YafY